jgi:hypothetical protein
LFTAALRANPWGLAISGALVLGGAIYGLTRNYSNLTQAEEDERDVRAEANKSIAQEIGQLELLKIKLNELNSTSAERDELMKQFNKTYKETIGIEMEFQNTLTGTNYLIDQAIEKIKKRALAQAAAAKSEQILTEGTDKYLTSLENISSRSNLSTGVLEDVGKWLKSMEAQGKLKIDKDGFVDLEALKKDKEAMADLRLVTSKMQQEAFMKEGSKWWVTDLSQAMKEYEKDIKRASKLQSDFGGSTNPTTDTTDPAADAAKAKEKAQSILDYQKKLAILAKEAII